MLQGNYCQNSFSTRNVLFLIPIVCLAGLLYFQNFITFDVGTLKLFNIRPYTYFGFIKSSFSPIEDEYEDYDNETKYILDWTTFFGTPMTTENGWLKDCPDFNCQMISQKSMLNRSHAVSFHMRNMDWNNLPLIRLPDQYYVFYLMESPIHSNVDSARADGFFNLTISYRLDSDFFSPYGDFRPISTDTDTKIIEVMDHLADLLQNKTKKVAWFVSNCATNSKRELLVSELQKHIKVDIFGACGSKHCPKTMSCNDMLKYDYKFYLSFENSICKDYVTEKLFDRINNYVVPIVLNRSYYEERLPPYSVISVSDFSNMQELVRYLNYLDKNMTAYAEYFKWRYEFVVNREYGGCATPKKCGFCGLCAFLHRKQKTKKINKEIHRWWHEDSRCDSTFVSLFLNRTK